MLDTLGLEAALAALAAEWSAQQGIPVAVDLPEGRLLRNLPEEVAVNLYRIVQEALSNVARHAQANHVVLCLVCRTPSEGLELTVTDDGVGCVLGPVDELTRQGHFGLTGIRERVALIGGAWRLESTPGHGTTLRITWRPGAAAPLN